MKRAEKLKEIEALWRQCSVEVPYEGIDWETGKYAGGGGQPELQIEFVEKLAGHLRTGCAFIEHRGEWIEISGWITGDYVLATYLYAWLHQPEDCLSPFLFDLEAGLICIPPARDALAVAALFDKPTYYTLGIEGLSEALKSKDESERRKWIKAPPSLLGIDVYVRTERHKDNDAPCRYSAPIAISRERKERLENERGLSS